MRDPHIHQPEDVERKGWFAADQSRRGRLLARHNQVYKMSFASPPSNLRDCDLRTSDEG